MEAHLGPGYGGYSPYLADAPSDKELRAQIRTIVKAIYLDNRLKTAAPDAVGAMALMSCAVAVTDRAAHRAINTLYPVFIPVGALRDFAVCGGLGWYGQLVAYYHDLGHAKEAAEAQLFQENQSANMVSAERKALRESIRNFVTHIYSNEFDKDDYEKVVD